MKRRSLLLSALLCLIVLLLTMDPIKTPASAADHGTCGDSVFWSLNEAGNLHISGTGPMQDYAYGKNAPWFTQRDKIKTAQIDSGVTSIGNYAFYYCNNLYDIDVPASVTSIGSHAFYGCERLKYSPIHSQITKIGYYAFSNCYGLTEVTVPEGITAIDGVFDSCIGLRKVSLPSTLVHIGNFTFAECRSLKSITIPKGVSTIGGRAFYNCYDLKDITVPKGITALGSYAFSGCANLTEFTVPGGIVELAEGTFERSGLTKIKLERGISSIGPLAFGNCRSLKSVWIPRTVTSIGEEAFSNCNSLETVYYAGPYTYQNEIRIDIWNDYLTSAYWDCYSREVSQPGITGVTRLAGADRIRTSFLVADRLKLALNVQKFDAVIVASGKTFADALPGSYLAAVKNAPILLTLPKDKYISQTADYIKANLKSGGTVYILGGESAVPKAMYDALTGFRVQRIAGADRFGTNLEILKVAGIQPGEEILVCTGKEYADSLSASATGKPILLVYKRLTDEQKSFLSRLSGNSFCVLGGTSAVSEELAAAISTYGPISRLAGKDRLDTSVLVAEKYFRDADAAVIAYGWGFPDGLCGGPLAYANKAPLVLTHSKNSLYTFTAGYTVPAKIREGYILGGDKLISDKATRTLFCMSDYAVLSKIS